MESITNKLSSVLGISKDDDVPPQEKINVDNLIAVMGVTGAGKSYLIREITGHDVVVSDKLESCTTKIGVYQFNLDGKVVSLIDTPGFNDTNMTDTQVLELITTWIGSQYKQNIKIKGVLFLHKIDENRMGGSSLRQITMFKKLCGNDCMPNISLITTMWSKIQQDDMNTATDREANLHSNIMYWKPMIDKGARVARYTSNEVIIDAIRNIVNKTHITPTIVREIVGEGKTLKQTEAGSYLNEEVIKKEREFAAHKKDMEEMHRNAIREKDNETKAAVEEEKRKIALQEKRIEEDKKIFERNLEKMKKDYDTRIKSMQRSDAQGRMAKRVLGSMTIMLGSALTLVCPPVGAAVMTGGGALVGSSVSPPKVQK